MSDFNFVTDPVNPAFVIISKLNSVDEAYANVKRTIISGKIDKNNYLKLSGEVIYLWEHLRPIVSDIKSKLDKKNKADEIKKDYVSEDLINILDGDEIPTYQNMKQIIRFFHDICYYSNITKLRSFTQIDFTKINAVRGGKNSTFFE